MATAHTRAQLRLAALVRVQERELLRAIYQAATAGGLSDRQINEITGVSLRPSAQRSLRRILELGPSQFEQAPAEIIDRRTAGLIDSDEMMNQLMHKSYSFGGVIRLNDAPTDAYERGDWDDVEMAFHQGLLDDEEFRQLAERHLPASRS
ncbi:winged helix-turn-helix domain-containing protein [Mycobacterium sp. 134]|uniref:winged helix-turn-helix domain-containing protein n=1 Tax=Mycobacterium sp. 134 TaxID=3400425 RepID=UPI003AACF17E